MKLKIRFRAVLLLIRERLKRIVPNYFFTKDEQSFFAVLLIILWLALFIFTHFKP
jgi:hypothetical protein